jgi:hypothetical protein
MKTSRRLASRARMSFFHAPDFRRGTLACLIPTRFTL